MWDKNPSLGNYVREVKTDRCIEKTVHFLKKETKKAIWTEVNFIDDSL